MASESESMSMSTSTDLKRGLGTQGDERDKDSSNIHGESVVTKIATDTDPDLDTDADAILAELEAEAEAEDKIASLRQQRIQEQLNAHKAANGGGERMANNSSTTGTTTTTTSSYMTLKSDDATLEFTTEHAKAVVHFFHPDFARCAVMDAHLEVIAKKHADFGSTTEKSETKFARVDVSHAPFVVERMGIRILPCVIGFVKGVVRGKVVGFEGLCWDGREKDQKVCQAVEERLVDWEVLKKTLVGKDLGQDDLTDSDNDDEEAEWRKENAGRSRRGIQGRKHNMDDSEDDWD